MSRTFWSIQSVAADAHLVVLVPTHQSAKSGCPSSRARLVELGEELGGDRHLLVLGRLGVEGVVQRRAAAPARRWATGGRRPAGRRRCRRAAVARAVLDHQQGRGLTSARVAAGGVAGPQRREEPVRERGLGVGCDSQAASMASTTSAPVRMLPWMAYAVAGQCRRPTRGRRWPVWEAAPPSTSTMPTWRWSRPSSSSSSRWSATDGGRALVEVGEGEPLVGDVGVGLGGDRADLGHGGRHHRPDGQELGGDGHPPRLSVVGPGHDREGHAQTLETRRPPSPRHPPRG